MIERYKFADVVVKIDSIYESVHHLCKSYKVTEETEQIMVRISQEDIDFERSRADHPDYSDEYLETLAVYRRIAEKMPAYDAFLFHGSAVMVDGEAYIFTATSGTGKSTHASLWREMFGSRAVMVNDDKPLIRVHMDGRVTVYGTPWDGKHHLSHNIAAPTRAICILERSAGNHIRKISKTEAMPMLLQQTYRPADPVSLAKTLILIERMNLKLYRLGCNMNPDAAEVAYTAMSENTSDDRNAIIGLNL